MASDIKGSSRLTEVKNSSMVTTQRSVECCIQRFVIAVLAAVQTCINTAKKMMQNDATICDSCSVCYIPHRLSNTSLLISTK